ncbi:MAG: uL15m family ribosomal protein [Candidatus Micrarchaeia archaeon]
MTVRIKSRKRKLYGNRTFGGGNKKNRRGKGCKGGKGRAGWHKHKWLLTIKNGENKNQKRGFHSVRARLETISLAEISRGIAKGEYKSGVAEFRGCKVLSNGSLSAKLTIKATAFSKIALEKIKAAGGEALTL